MFKRPLVSSEPEADLGFSRGGADFQKKKFRALPKHKAKKSKTPFLGTF